jgi:uncharacterized protein (DUF1684 family)
MHIKFSLFIFALVFILLSDIQAQKNLTNKRYKQEIRKARIENDRDFKEAANSPLDPEYIPAFKGLDYFRIDPAWKIDARLTLNENPDTIKMKTTTERLPLYLVYGKAGFSVDGKEFYLTVYRNTGLMTKPGYEDYLFIPFTDQTSGNGSYGGGRYIDARITGNDHILIDFNKAYNPYCVYNKKYSCPIPPAENFLDIKVTAGVKDFHHE